MSGSCHFNRASNDKFSVEYLFKFFQSTKKSNLKVVQITKMISFELMHPYNLNVPQIVKLDLITITNIWHSTPISTFDALSKWHEPDIHANYTYFHASLHGWQIRKWDFSCTKFPKEDCKAPHVSSFWINVLGGLI